MNNIVSMGAGRPRRQRQVAAPDTSARILFFTGVRYCRTEEPMPYYPDSDPIAVAHAVVPSERMIVDAATH